MGGLQSYIKADQRTELADVPEDKGMLKGIKSYDGVTLCRIVNGGGIISEKVKRGRRDKGELHVEDEMLQISKIPYMIGYDQYEKKLEDYDLELYCPICLILDLDKLIADGKIKAVYPFDPNSIAGIEDELEEYALEPDSGIIVKYIVIFYGTVKAYINGEDREGLTEFMERTNIYADRVRKIHEKKNGREEMQTITMTLKEEISVDQYLQCIIYPEKLNCREEFVTLQSKREVRCITYKTSPHRSPIAYNEKVLYLLKEAMGFCEEELQ